MAAARVGGSRDGRTVAGRTPVRVLILEDSPHDAELVVRELKRAGYEPEWTRVETEPDFAAALTPDLELILSDYSLPQYDGIHAAALVREQGLDIPFILISGTLGEDAAVTAIKEGVDDYLLKDRLTRLGSAVAAALEARRLREAGRQAEREARASEDRFRALAEVHAAMLDALPANVALLNGDGVIVAVNEAWRQFARDNALVDPAFGVGQNYVAVARRATGPFGDEADEAADGIHAVLNGVHTQFVMEYPCHAPDARRWFRLMATRLRREERAGAVVMHVDITDRKVAEEGLRKLSMAVEQSPVSIVITDTGGRIEYVNPFLTSVSGYSVEEVHGQNPRIWRGGGTPAETYADLWRTITGGGIWEGELENTRKDGIPFWEHVRIAPIRDTAGVLTNYVAVKQDITQRRAADHALRAAQQRLQHVVESSSAVIFVQAATPEPGVPVWISANVSDVLGYEPADVATFGWWQDRIHPDDRDSVIAAALRVPASGSMTHEYRFRAASGSYRWIHDERRLVRDVASGRLEVVGSWLDVTERKDLESQFHQSQKMEAVGRLAGGIAHDFNNLLTVMMGYAELTLTDLAPDLPLRADIAEILSAGERSRDLIRQLLAFSRQQVLAPRVLSLNAVVSSIEPMLRRLVGEDVEVVCGLSPDIGPILADVGNIEQVIVNLAVNARDAMPDGGTLTIETGERDLPSTEPARSGLGASVPHVLLAVSDTGTGMDDATKARIFDPFFTTKEQGKGTGLGLSTVYGIVKQSGGEIAVYSEPGEGTTFKVYLPRTSGVAEPIVAAPAQEPVRGGHETILVVEDEPMLRAFCHSVLSRLGYQVVVAANPEQALPIFKARPDEIDLVITDIVMPGMPGTELADRLVQIRPSQRVVFVSGYTTLALSARQEPSARFPLLEKPFSPASLGRLVRTVLDRD